ncbi:hypothetical protein CEY12_03220 [Chryseobacterium sp. T16E-39]|uniref:HD domain-containing protein n=1 Tax=Chryseobacterium sp. T16E-39 TaxID=2015076 RepID=UPI000B5B48ED|nr:HD domain-containing protein [Chryseobacterium sp. T16E-39]ASK29175.1 hypothetical protein CEY12_03220 [Chryseobacterium sp. T16E-39]
MNNLLETVSNYILSYLTENLSVQLSFHHIQHTREVVNAAKEIGEQSNLSEDEMLVLQTAAWFHDCGYATTYIGHEEESKKIANSFLINYGCEESFIQSVLHCIESTKYPQKPTSLVDKILCDADLYHLALPSYPKYGKAIRKEFEIYLGQYYTDEEWLINNCQFLTNHSYYTDYGKQILEEFKKVNIQLMNCKQNKF